jgi:type III pantothenate kinase
MLLCDIGNTSYHFLDVDEEFKKSVHTFNPLEVKEKVYYISVNTKVNQELEGLENWIDLGKFVDKQKYYETMGIDRIFACEYVTHGIIIDAGSAVTVDVMREGVFEGGFIYPGVQAMQTCYANISPLLNYSFNFELNLDKMAKNSQDALSYGYLRTLVSEVERHHLPVFLTGGDAKKFHKLFGEAEVDEMLLFNSMKKIMKKADLC